MTTISAANLGGVADPRLGHEADEIGDHAHGTLAAQDTPLPAVVEARRHSAIYVDKSVSFEDYHYWANQSREIEREIDVSGEGIQGLVKVLLGKKTNHTLTDAAAAAAPATTQPGKLGDNEKRDELMSTVVAPPHGHGHADEKSDAASQSSPARSDREDRYGISLGEWDLAQRAMRTASWGSIFYLITTDILGPYNVPWAIAQMGYGPGFALYTVFALMALYSGLQLWQQFMGLDSTRFPMRNYGDLAFRIYGNWARIGVNVLQSFQFFLNVALLIESNGQGLSQMAAGKSGTGFLCFVAAEVIFMACGFVLGQIRTLQRLSWLANLAVWLNVFCIIMTMIVTAYYPPNYAAVANAGGAAEGEPITHTANWPPGTDLKDRINGLMNGVFAFGGATLFNELMAEMRRPMDFWKGLICAEIFIYIVYIVMGMVVYTNQGQYTYNIAYQGISNSAYGWQTTGNAINLVSGLIAALLYGNIGVKVFYASVCRDVFHLPALDKKTGKYIWVALIPIYWGLAFVVAAAIPQIANLTSFVGAACILQFSYTFPPILKVGYNCQKDAMLPEEIYDPATGHVQRVDSGFARWWRGFKVQWAINTFDVLYFLGAVATAGLGIYASTTAMHEAFASERLTPFTCKSPVT